MKRKEIWITVIIIILILGLGFYFDKKSRTGSNEEISTNATSSDSVDTRVESDSGSTLNIANDTYTIDGTLITLTDGMSSSAVANSSLVRKTVLLEGPAFADVNGDNIKDAVVLLRDEPGGSGTFYYVSAVLSSGTSEKATTAILLGDRIRIKEILVDNEVISVTILDRDAAEPMTTAPHIEKTLKFTVTGETLTPAL